MNTVKAELCIWGIPDSNGEIWKKGCVKTDPVILGVINFIKSRVYNTPYPKVIRKAIIGGVMYTIATPSGYSLFLIDKIELITGLNEAESRELINELERLGVWIPYKEIELPHEDIYVGQVNHED